MDFLIGSVVLVVYVAVMGLLVPYVLRQATLVRLHNIRDEIYAISLERDRWLLDLRFYRLCEASVTGMIFFVRYTTYWELLKIIVIRARLKYQAQHSPERSEYAEEIVDEVHQATSNSDERRETLMRFNALVSSTDCVLHDFLAFGHYLVAPFGLIYFAARTLHRMRGRFPTSSDGDASEAEAIMAAVLETRAVAGRKRLLVVNEEPESVAV